MFNNITKWQQLYLNNARLDNIFLKSFPISKEEMHQDNCIETMVEIGEFINETKIFKYWSIKKPNKDKVLEEYADCITMILVFFNELQIDLRKIKFQKIENNNILEVLNNLYQKCTELMHNLNKQIILEIFNYLLNIASLLEISEDEILTALEKKQQIVEDRLNNEY